MTRLRARVAERLKGAQNTYAMLTTFNEIDMTNLMKLRSDYKVRRFFYMPVMRQPHLSWNEWPHPDDAAIDRDASTSLKKLRSDCKVIHVVHIEVGHLLRGQLTQAALHCLVSS